LIQAKIGSDGAVDLDYEVDETLDVDANIKMDSAVAAKLLEELDELSQMSIEHDLQGDDFRLAFHHRSGVSMFELQETHVFNEGIKSHGLNGSKQIIKPTFRTFKSNEGPHARVQMNGDGQLIGLVTHRGELVQFRKHLRETGASVVYLNHKLEEQLRNTETKYRREEDPEKTLIDVLNEHVDMEQNDEGVWFAVDRGHECGRKHGDGIDNPDAKDGEGDTWCEETDGKKTWKWRKEEGQRWQEGQEGWQKRQERQGRQRQGRQGRRR